MSFKRSIQVFLLTLIFTGIFQFTHESGHLVVASLYGGESTWSFSGVVQIWDETPQNPETWSEITLPSGQSGWIKTTIPESQSGEVLFSLMGPVFSLATLLLMLIVYFRVATDKHRAMMLSGIFIISFTLFFYYLRAASANWNDEKDAANLLNINVLLLTVPASIIYLAALIFSSIKLYRLKFRFLDYLLMMIGTIATGISMNRVQSIIIEQVDAGNALFRPVMGYSLPVFVTFAVCFLVFAGIWFSPQYAIAEESDNSRDYELNPAAL